MPPRPSVKELLAPSRRNAIITFLFLFIIYNYVIISRIIVGGDIDRLRIGAYHNEVFAVTPHHKPPAVAFWMIGCIPLVLAVYVCYFFLPRGAGGVNTPNPNALLNALSEPKAKFAIIAASLCTSIVLSLRILSAFALVCNYPLHEMTNLCSFSHDVIDVIRAKHGPDSVWLYNGTLIGALRGDVSKNRMIQNDHDFDTCYDKRIEPFILETIRSLGVTYERFSRTYTDKDVHIRVYPPTFSLLSGHSGPLMLELQACEPVGTAVITGCNNLPVNIPLNYDEYLSGEFGKDWLIPRADNHAVICKILKGW